MQKNMTTELSKKCVGEMQILLRDMEAVSELYRPTQFWANCSQSIVREFESQGLQSFKSLLSSRTWFVPNYAKGRETPSRRLKALRDKGLLPKGKLFRRIEDYYSGRLQAVADYRIAKASFIQPHPFLSQGESSIGDGLQHVIEGVPHSKASLNYLRGLSFLQRTPGYFEHEAKSFLEIGGGFGSLGEIVMGNSADQRYLNIDIPPVLTASSYYLKAIFGDGAIASYVDTRGLDTIDAKELLATRRGATLPAWQLPNLRGSFDCFVNFVSFQEMEPDVVENYIRLVQPLTKHYVLLRNSKHGKKISTSSQATGVNKATTIDMMINWFSDFELVNRDSFVFGDESRFGNFKSEVVVLKRRK